MIKVLVSIDKECDYKSIEFSGHALFANYGNDIVCAAVSILAINTLNSIEVFCRDKVEVIDDAQKGYLKLIFKSKLSDNANLLIKSLMLGLDGISHEYGKKFITIIRQEV
ncbi:MAG: ribosomal-processing cysteine protease Prp [Catonella sp.]|uniref:ribosomal-processing cysteine protease Prp n=1 Tax=Catonella sp. TaxID=2382125 RepID=UPI003FA0687F